MKGICLLFVSFVLLLSACDNGIDKVLVSNAVKLPSPYSAFTLYRYHVESSMAFGSGFTAIKILPTEERCDFTERDFFRFGNNYPLVIKWKNKDTLQVKCLSEGGLAKSQPVAREIKKWKNWVFDVEYYSMFSTGATDSLPIDGYRIGSDSIRFNSTTRSVGFNKNEVAIELDSDRIYVRQFKVDTFNRNTGLSLSGYKLAMGKTYQLKDFYDIHPFIATTP